MKATRMSALVLAASLTLSGCGGGSEDADTAASTGAAESQDAAATSVPQGDSADATAAAPKEDDTSSDDAAGDDAAGDDASAQEGEATSGEDASGGDTAEKDENGDYVYPDEPEPAPEIAATLCNLDADYFRNLRPTDASGKAVANESLRMSVLSLGDNLSLWNDLQRNFPEVEDDVSRAQDIYDYWDEALLNADNGDQDAADKAMRQAEAEIDRMPTSAPDVIDSCQS